MNMQYAVTFPPAQDTADEFLKGRFASVLSNYKTTRKYSANFIFLIHDLWGADGSQNSSAPYPGDNGVWTSWDAYLTRVIADVKANSMTAGLYIDIWNEPDLSYFWTKGEAQYLKMWGRTYHRLRFVLILPSLARRHSPLSSH